MSNVPAVIVRKGGFLSALFHGLFGFLTAVVVCASALGFYAMHVVDSKVSSVFAITSQCVSGLPEWRRTLPPVLADALDDRRAPDYRGQIDISVARLPSPENPGKTATIVTVNNKGSETVSVLALNVVLEQGGVPVAERRVYAATPIALDEGEWRGPLYPDTTRTFAVRGYWGPRDYGEAVTATAQIAELRVWSDSRGSESVAVERAELDQPVADVAQGG